MRKLNKINLITKNIISEIVIKAQTAIRSRAGFGTLEVVIIIAVLLAIALIFRKTLTEYASKLIDAVFDESVIDNMGDYQLN